MVYLAQAGGQLSSAELAGHPEILVTSSYAEFKQTARHRITLWVDKNAAQLVDPEGINSLPQATYLIFVIGYNLPLFALNYKLGVNGFSAHPFSEDEIAGAEGGFSAIEKTGHELGAQVILLSGYQQTPTVDHLLSLSNDL